MAHRPSDFKKIIYIFSWSHTNSHIFLICKPSFNLQSNCFFSKKQKQTHTLINRMWLWSGLLKTCQTIAVSSELTEETELSYKLSSPDGIWLIRISACQHNIGANYDSHLNNAIQWLKQQWHHSTLGMMKINPNRQSKGWQQIKIMWALRQPCDQSEKPTQDKPTELWKRELIDDNEAATPMTCKGWMWPVEPPITLCERGTRLRWRG